MDSKLLFFDIDGTLIDCHIGMRDIPDNYIKTLDRLKENGHKVFLATGRCKCFILPGVMSYPFDGYVTCNGGYVEYEGNEVFKEVASVEGIKAAMALSEKYHFNYYFEANDHIYVRDKQDEKHIRFANNWGMKEEDIIDDFDPSDIETYIGMIVINNKEEQEFVYRELSPYFDVQRHKDWFSFDLTLKGTSKGHGIEALVHSLGYSMKDTIAFGDGRNDVEMLKKTAIGIAMGNAMEEALEAADYITDRVEEDGITKACHHFSLL